ncbi:MAG TPA: hypothetical protein PKD86_18450 [Gemmatales bacterium]|nr:hypothetical protein [Gemmatales bacterium]HMP61327.1 hypothetical protein [Gemmatales bacterium]
MFFRLELLLVFNLVAMIATVVAVLSGGMVRAASTAVALGAWCVILWAILLYVLVSQRAMI